MFDFLSWSLYSFCENYNSGAPPNFDKFQNFGLLESLSKCTLIVSICLRYIWIWKYTRKKHKINRLECVFQSRLLIITNNSNPHHKLKYCAKRINFPILIFLFKPFFLQIHFFVWCMKVSRESSRAYMKLVWWIGDWVPGKQQWPWPGISKSILFKSNFYLWTLRQSFCPCRWGCPHPCGGATPARFCSYLDETFSRRNFTLHFERNIWERWKVTKKPWTCPLRPGSRGSQLRSPWVLLQYKNSK